MIDIYPIFYENSLRSINYTIETRLENQDYLIILDPTDGHKVNQDISQRNSDYFLSENKVILINTHHHFDHVGGNTFFQEKISGLNHYHHQNWEEFNRSYGLSPFSLIQIPGHTQDHIGLMVEDEGENKVHWFFGDTLFHYGIGNTKNGGDLNLFFQTIQNIEKLYQSYAEKSWTVNFYPAHDYADNNYNFLAQLSHLNIELDNFKKLNKTNDDYFNFSPDQNIFFHQDFEMFTQLRQLRDQF